MTTELRYRSNVGVEDLEVGDCTMHRAATADGHRWWLLWFRVVREDTGVAADFAVPMNPNGSFIEAGTGGKTWGLTAIGGGRWQVSPSINVLPDRRLHAGEHPAGASQWHQTPAIVDVPVGEHWITEQP